MKHGEFSIGLKHPDMENWKNGVVLLFPNNLGEFEKPVI
jgi:hypothetical protein